MQTATIKKQVTRKTKQIKAIGKETAKDVSKDLSHFGDMANEVLAKFKNGEITAMTKDYLKNVDYETFLKETLKVVVPLLAVRYISSRGKPSARREELLDCLVDEAKTALKKKKII